MIKKFVPIQPEQVKDDDQFLLEKEYAAGVKFDAVLISEHYLFWWKMLRIHYVSLEKIRRAYVRQEDTRITLCCGKGILPSFFLMLDMGEQNQIKIQFEKKSVVERVIQLLTEKNPSIRAGYHPGTACKTGAQGEQI